MSRRKSVRDLEKQLEYARRRAAFTPPADTAGVSQRRPKRAVQYNSILIPRAYTVQASEAGLTFFGGLTALGLADDEDDGPAPRGFKPAQIHAMQADATPQPITARASGRRYIRYARGTRGSSVQSTFSAPISGTGTSATVGDVKTKYETISNAKASTVGAYGRIWLTWEQLPLASSGTGGGGV